MKKILLLLIIGIFVFTGCAKTPVADFENISNKTDFSINELIAMDNKSSNYESFYWETREYTTNGTSFSPYHTYEINYREVLHTKGKKEIVLHVYSKDKKQESTKSIIIELK